MGSLRLFEVDHVATQAWKRERAAKLALPISEGHVFVPVDFETQTLRDGLDLAGFDWSRSTLFSWIGTTMYLTTDSIEATLRTVATCAPGSEIVLSYNPAPEFLDDIGREFLAAVSPRAAEIGETVLTFFSPTAMETLIERCGLIVAEHPTSDDLCGRYCSGRTDGLRPYTTERLVAARPV